MLADLSRFFPRPKCVNILPAVMAMCDPFGKLGVFWASRACVRWPCLARPGQNVRNLIEEQG